jgi:hypothetical protein
MLKRGEILASLSRVASIVASFSAPFVSPACSHRIQNRLGRIYALVFTTSLEDPAHVWKPQLSKARHHGAGQPWH